MAQQPDRPYTATVDEVTDIDVTTREEEERLGTGSTEDAENLPQEFDDLTTDTVSGDLDRDDEALARKMAMLENEQEVTDADAEGIEGDIKSLNFKEAGHD